MTKPETMWAVFNSYDQLIHAVGQTRQRAIEVFLCGFPKSGWKKKWYKHGFRTARVNVSFIEVPHD